MSNKSYRAFTLVELIVVMAVIGFLFSIVIASLSSIQRDARDARRVEDLRELKHALELFYTDHNRYPRELADEANGPLSSNQNLRTLLKPYLQGFPVDPAGLNDPVFDYYYDGFHFCAGEPHAVMFARQMDNPSNSNYEEVITTTCSGALDGEGRGGGTESYTLILGEGAE